ncbi:MAG: tetratricopeptide repeat protein [Chitinispirillaceae bacterium]|nr:tetratricopeptide repeat protein [Chitinispirillaceae bacterium]
MAPYDDFKRMLRERRFKEAAALAETQAFGGGGDGVFWLNQQAIALVRMGSYHEAVAVADQALSRNPSGFYSLLIRSEAQFKQGDFAAALVGFQEARRFPAVECRARKGALDCLIGMRRFEEALAALAGWNGDVKESYPFRIKALRGLHRIDEAIAVCREWLGGSADNRQALWLLCDLETRRDGIEATLAKYEKMAKIPSLPPIYGELCAMLYRKAGKTDRALGQYDRLTTRSNDPAILRRKAFALAKSGREREALPLLEELLRARPSDQYVHSAYGAAARRGGYLEKAWKFYHELLTLYPEEKSLYGRIKKIGKTIEALPGGAPPEKGGEP